MWVPTKTDHIFVFKTEGADGKTLTLEHDYDLTQGARSAIPADHVPALPDFDGLIWFVSKIDGKIGTLNASPGRQGPDHERGDGELI